MASKGRLTDEAATRRDQIEIAMFCLAGVLVDLDEVMLRT